MKASTNRHGNHKDLFIDFFFFELVFYGQTTNVTIVPFVEGEGPMVASSSTGATILLGCLIEDLCPLHKASSFTILRRPLRCTLRGNCVCAAGKKSEHSFALRASTTKGRNRTKLINQNVG